jgi:hypothetical protein
MRNACRILFGKLEGKGSLENPGEDGKIILTHLPPCLAYKVMQISFETRFKFHAG